MNRRTFLQAALSLIPAPLLTRLPIAQAVEPVRKAIWTTPPDAWTTDGLVSAERFNKPMIAEIIGQYGVQSDTRVDFAPTPDDLVYASSGMPVNVSAFGEVAIGAGQEAYFDLVVDGIRQRQELVVRRLRNNDDAAQQFCLLWEIMPPKGTHTYGIVQRVRNGTATTNARIHVSEVW